LHYNRIWLDTAWFEWYNHAWIQFHKFGVVYIIISSLSLGIHKTQYLVIMKLEDAIEIVLESVRRNSVGSDGMLTDQGAEELEATGVVEDFFVNNVFDGTE